MTAVTGSGGLACDLDQVAGWALPLIAGCFGTYLLFGSAFVRAGAAPWATVIMVGILFAWMVISHIIELILRRRISSRHGVLREALSTAIGLVNLAE